MQRDTFLTIDGQPFINYRGRLVPVPRGGADDETPPAELPPEGGDAPAEGDQAEQPDETAAPAVPADLEGVDEAELRSTHEALGEYRVAARERHDVAAVRAAYSDQERIVAELVRRQEERRRELQELEELDQLETPALPEPEPALAGAGVSAAQLASLRTPQAPAAQVPPAAPNARPRAALLAAAGTEVLPAGQEMSYGQLGQAIDRAKRGRPGQTILASIQSFEEAPEGVPAILSERNGATLNDELIAEAVSDWRAREYGTEPIMASARQGAICGPFDIIRDIPDAFSTATPVADIFPARPGGRGGWQFTPSGTLADVSGAVTLWDEADQAAVNPDNASTWKPCVEYDCPDTQTAVLEAVVQCVTFPITLEMSNPERVRNLNNAVGALRARTHEGRILQRMDQLSHGFVFSGDYGALPTLVEAINSLLPQLNWWNRQEPGDYVMVLPPAVTEVLRIDRASRAYGTEMETQDVLDYLQANVGVRRIVQSLDASLGGEPGTFKDPLPPVGNQVQAGAVPYISGAAYRIRLIDPAAAIYAETGEMNAGVLRDANLIRQNRTGYFTEQFFMLEKHGPQPWASIDVELCADGARAGLVEPNGCTVS